MPSRFILRVPFLALVTVLGAPLLAACEPSAGPDVQYVEQPQAAELVEGTSGLVVVDVRTASEFESGHIEGAINLDVTRPDFERKLAALDRDKPHLVHCAAGTPGGRSNRAVDAMKRQGFDRIYHLNGGLAAWKKGGGQVSAAGQAHKP